MKKISGSTAAHTRNEKTRGDRRAAKRGRQALDSAPDWFGCGRTITTESWNRFLSARKDYYDKQDRLAVNAINDSTLTH